MLRGKLILLFVAGVVRSADVELDLSQFMPTVADSEELWLVRFTSDTKKPYAPLCKKMNAPWDELTKTMSKIKTASIDVSDPEGQGAKIAKKLGVFREGLPNMKLFKVKSDYPDKVLAAESATFKKIKKRLGRLIKGLKKNAAGVFLKHSPGNVKELSEDTYAQFLQFGTTTDDQTAFVFFYSPTCRHCQEVQPIVAKIADQLQESHAGKFHVGKINCHDFHRVCSNEGVAAHPTMMRFTKAMFDKNDPKEPPGEVYNNAGYIEQQIKEFLVDHDAYTAKVKEADKATESEKSDKNPEPLHTTRNLEEL